jgi:plastocyanin
MFRRSQLTACLFLAATLTAMAGGNIRVEIKNAKGEPIADAVASLISLTTTADLNPPAEPVSVVQSEEEFSPYVTAIVAGTKVSFPNRDKVQHHVYSLSKAKSFELPLYRDQPHEPILFDHAGIVSLGCNIHDWMSAYIVVLATPYFAKTLADGVAPLTTVPPGRYRLEVWHPRIAAVVTRDVTIDPTDAETQVISVTLRPDRRIRRAPEAGGGSYK